MLEMDVEMVTVVRAIEPTQDYQKYGSSAGPRFDSGRNPENSNLNGFELIDAQARVLN